MCSGFLVRHALVGERAQDLALGALFEVAGDEVHGQQVGGGAGEAQAAAEEDIAAELLAYTQRATSQHERVKHRTRHLLAQARK